MGKPAISFENGDLSIDRANIKNKEDFRDICLSKAMTVIGEDLSAVELLKEIEKDKPFYQESGGGVTLSGGEPLSQNGSVTYFLDELNKNKIHTSVETTLHVTWNQIERSLGKVDCFLVDLKHTEGSKFREYTEGDLELVISNLKKLDELKQNIIIRIPVIPGFNHTLKEMKGIINLAASLQSVQEIHFIPYHTLGSEKYKMLGMDYPYSNYKGVSNTELTPYLEYAESKGLRAKIGG
jgi:pyruvate formate lyase activating enzyme